jgi:hypothetical protein
MVQRVLQIANSDSLTNVLGAISFVLFVIALCTLPV